MSETYKGRWLDLLVTGADPADDALFDRLVGLGLGGTRSVGEGRMVLTWEWAGADQPQPTSERDALAQAKAAARGEGLNVVGWCFPNDPAWRWWEDDDPLPTITVATAIRGSVDAGEAEAEPPLLTTSHPGFRAALALDEEALLARHRRAPIMVVSLDDWGAVRDLLHELVTAVRADAGRQQASEADRRERAQQGRGHVVPGSGRPVEPRPFTASEARRWPGGGALTWE
jgi:hypothetical protein